MGIGRMRMIVRERKEEMAKKRESAKLCKREMYPL